MASEFPRLKTGHEIILGAELRECGRVALKKIFFKFILREIESRSGGGRERERERERGRENPKQTLH